MSDRNPFTIFGFAPALFKGLADTEIRELVDSQYRALSRLHHPDRQGGNVDKFKEIQDAYDRLKEDFQFDFWKKTFLRNRKDHVAELEKSCKSATAEAIKLQGNLIDFWMAFLSAGETYMDPTFRGLPSHEDDIGKLSVFDPCPACLLISDCMGNVLYEQARMEADNGVVIPRNSRPFELQILPGGVLQKIGLTKVGFDPEKTDVPRVRKELIELNPKRPSSSYYWREEEPQLLNGVKLLGSLERTSSTKSTHSITVPKALIPTDIRPQDLRIIHEGYTPSEFQPFLRLVKPWVETYYQIVACSIIKGELRFMIMGYLRRIFPL